MKVKDGRNNLKKEREERLHHIRIVDLTIKGLHDDTQ